MVVLKARGAFQSILCRIHDRVPGIVVFPFELYGVEGNDNLFFAHAEEAPDANYKRRCLAAAIDENVQYFTNLIIGRIVDVLLYQRFTVCVSAGKLVIICMGEPGLLAGPAASFERLRPWPIKKMLVQSCILTISTSRGLPYFPHN